MKLKMFNHSNSGGKKTGVPAISISPVGAMRLNIDAVSLIITSKDSMVEFAQSEERPKDWYITESTSEDAFKLRADERGAVVQNAFTAREIIKSIGGAERTIAFRISTTPELVNKSRLYPIITANPIKVMGSRSKENKQ